MNYKALVQSPPTGDGSPGNAVRALVSTLWTFDYNDVTLEQTTHPPTGYFVLDVTCSAVVLGAITQDTRFAVLSSELIEDDSDQG